MVRFDAYSATTQAAKANELVSLLAEAAEGRSVSLKQGRGFHTFGERISLKDETGGEFASVMWGGRQGDRCMVEVKGEATPVVVEALRSRFPHRCTRVDSCADFDAPGAFESLLGACVEVKKEHRLLGGKAGDWDDFPELGRTLYLGSKHSVSRLRLYEKGKQPEYAHLDRPHWARIEAQIRPAKEAKAEFARLAGRVLQEHVDPHPAGTTYRLTERENALRWMCKQYGTHLVSLASDLGGWEVLGLTLRELLNDQEGGPAHH